MLNFNLRIGRSLMIKRSCLWSQPRLIGIRCLSLHGINYQKDKPVSLPHEYNESGNRFSKVQKKWTWSRLKPLKQWNEDTLSLYGPKLKSTSKQKNKPSKTSERATTKGLDVNKNIASYHNVAVNFENENINIDALSDTSKNNNINAETTDKTNAVSEVNNARFSTTSISEKMFSKKSSINRSDSGSESEKIATDFKQKTSSRENKYLTKNSAALGSEKVDYEDISSSDEENNDSKSSSEFQRISEPVSYNKANTDYNSFIKQAQNLTRLNYNDEEGAELKAFLSTLLHYPLFSNDVKSDSFLNSSSMIQGVNGAGRSVEAREEFDGCMGGYEENDCKKDPFLQLPRAVLAHCPSVSAILSSTMPPENKLALQRWEQQMIQELGVEGFAQHKKETLSMGTNLHTSIQRHLDGQTFDLDSRNAGHWNSMETALTMVKHTECQESNVKHPVLNYKGILDCVAVFGGVRSMIEWKTSKKARADIRYTYDNPLQLAAYLGAYNSVPTNDQIDQCVLVIGHEDGSPADVHVIRRIDCVKYWKQWLRRVHTYWIQYTKVYQ